MSWVWEKMVGRNCPCVAGGPGTTSPIRSLLPLAVEAPRGAARKPAGCDGSGNTWGGTRPLGRGSLRAVGCTLGCHGAIVWFALRPIHTCAWGCTEGVAAILAMRGGRLTCDLTGALCTEATAHCDGAVAARGAATTIPTRARAYVWAGVTCATHISANVPANPVVRRVIGSSATPHSR